MELQLSLVVLLGVSVHSSKLPDRCDDSTAVDNGHTGSALLQSKRSEARLLQRHDPKDELSPSSIGKTATFDEDGYQAVASTCCLLDMEIYVRRLIEHKELELCNEYGLLGFVPWYTCDVEQTGTEVQSFAKLLHGIGSSQPPTHCAFVAPFGMCPSDYSNCGGEPSPETHRRRTCTSQSNLSPHGAPSRRRQISPPSPSAPSVPVAPVPSPPLPTSPAAPMPYPTAPTMGPSSPTEPSFPTGAPTPQPAAPAVAPPSAPETPIIPPTPPPGTPAAPTPAPPTPLPAAPSQHTPAPATPAAPTPVQPSPAPPTPLPATASQPTPAPPTPAAPTPTPPTPAPPTPAAPTPAPPTPAGTAPITPNVPVPAPVAGQQLTTAAPAETAPITPNVPVPAPIPGQQYTTTTTTAFLCRLCRAAGLNIPVYWSASATPSDQSACWATYELDDPDAECEWRFVEGVADVMGVDSPSIVYDADNNPNRNCKPLDEGHYKMQFLDEPPPDDYWLTATADCAGYCEANANCRFFSVIYMSSSRTKCRLCGQDAVQSTWENAGVNDDGNTAYTVTYERGANCAQTVTVGSRTQKSFCTQSLNLMDGTDLAAGSYNAEDNSNRHIYGCATVELQAGNAQASDCLSVCYQSATCNYVSIVSANSPDAHNAAPTVCHICENFAIWQSAGSYNTDTYSGEYLTGSYRREYECSTSGTSTGSSSSSTDTSTGASGGTVTSTSGASGGTTITTDSSSSSTGTSTGSSGGTGTSTSGASGGTTITTGSSSSSTGTSTGASGGSGTVTTGGADGVTSDGSTGASGSTSGGSSSWVVVMGDESCLSSEQATGSGDGQEQVAGSGMYCTTLIGEEGKDYTLDQCAQLCEQNSNCVRFSYGRA